MTQQAPHILDGKATAAEIITTVKAEVETMSIQPGLAVILVGSDPASSVYVRNKGLRAKECGFHSEQFDMPEDTTEATLLAKIDELNNDERIHGILVQLPLPKQIDPDKVIQAIAPHKDVDGFHYENVGRLSTGAMDTAMVACTPLGCIHLIKKALGNNLSGKHAVIVGRSNIVGKPVANLLLQENCTISVLHSRTQNPEAICSTADIVVAAVGVPELVKASWVKEGAVVIDVGINRVTDTDGNNKLVGDVDFADVEAKAASITPVPGGVGPMTIAMLMQNTLTAAKRTS